MEQAVKGTKQYHSHTQRRVHLLLVSDTMRACALLLTNALPSSGSLPSFPPSSQIKKAYRRLALQYHPDKVGTSEATTQKFHQIGFAYAVLNDDMRKKRYDETGRTDESFFEGEADWNAYFRELWKGEVNQKTLDEFVEKYKGEWGLDVVPIMADRLSDYSPRLGDEESVGLSGLCASTTSAHVFSRLFDHQPMYTIPRRLGGRTQGHPGCLCRTRGLVGGAV